VLFSKKKENIFFGRPPADLPKKFVSFCLLPGLWRSCQACVCCYWFCQQYVIVVVVLFDTKPCECAAAVNSVEWATLAILFDGRMPVLLLSILSKGLFSQSCLMLLLNLLLLLNTVDTISCMMHMLTFCQKSYSCYPVV
jgi:hypothetical protein